MILRAAGGMVLVLVLILEGKMYRQPLTCSCFLGIKEGRE